jgi:hypothetical protein
VTYRDDTATTVHSIHSAACKFSRVPNRKRDTNSLRLLSDLSLYISVAQYHIIYYHGFANCLLYELNETAVDIHKLRSVNGL